MDLHITLKHKSISVCNINRYMDLIFFTKIGKKKYDLNGNFIFVYVRGQKWLVDPGLYIINYPGSRTLRYFNETELVRHYVKYGVKNGTLTLLTYKKEEFIEFINSLSTDEITAELELINKYNLYDRL